MSECVIAFSFKVSLSLPLFSIIALNIGTCIAFFVIIGDLAPPVLAKLTGIDIVRTEINQRHYITYNSFSSFPSHMHTLTHTLSYSHLTPYEFFF